MVLTNCLAGSFGGISPRTAGRGGPEGRGPQSSTTMTMLMMAVATVMAPIISPMPIVM